MIAKLRIPEFLLAHEQLLLLDIVLGVALLATPPHPFCNGGYGVYEVVGFTNYHIPIRAEDSIHLEEHIFHFTSAPNFAPA